MDEFKKRVLSWSRANLYLKKRNYDPRNYAGVFKGVEGAESVRETIKIVGSDHNKILVFAAIETAREDGIKESDTRATVRGNGGAYLKKMIEEDIIKKTTVQKNKKELFTVENRDTIKSVVEVLERNYLKTFNVPNTARIVQNDLTKIEKTIYISILKKRWTLVSAESLKDEEKIPDGIVVDAINRHLISLLDKGLLAKMSSITKSGAQYALTIPPDKISEMLTAIEIPLVQKNELISRFEKLTDERARAFRKILEKSIATGFITISELSKELESSKSTATEHRRNLEGDGLIRCIGILNRGQLAYGPNIRKEQWPDLLKRIKEKKNEAYGKIGTLATDEKTVLYLIAKFEDEKEDLAADRILQTPLRDASDETNTGIKKILAALREKRLINTGNKIELKIIISPNDSAFDQLKIDEDWMDKWFYEHFPKKEKGK